MDELIKERWMN